MSAEAFQLTQPPAGSLFELVLLVPEAAVDDVGDALVALDALSVSVEDADAMTDAESALFGEPGMPPPMNLASTISSRCSAMLVWMPSITVSFSAVRMRAIACSRVSP